MMTYEQRIERAKKVAFQSLYASKDEYIETIVAAFLGDDEAWTESYPNPGDGTTLSEEEHDEAHETWCQIREAKRLGYLVPLNKEE